MKHLLICYIHVQSLLQCLGFLKIISVWTKNDFQKEFLAKKLRPFVPETRDSFSLSRFFKTSNNRNPILNNNRNLFKQLKYQGRLSSVVWEPRDQTIVSDPGSYFSLCFWNGLLLCGEKCSHPPTTVKKMIFFNLLIRKVTSTICIGLGCTCSVLRQ